MTVPHVLTSLLALAQLPAAHSTSLPSRPWTILVYGAADNNADGPILEFLDQVRQAIDADPGIELLVWLDRSAEYSTDASLLGEDFTGTRLYRLQRDSAERLSGGEEIPEITLAADVELDSADANQLRRFIRFGKRYYPARRTGLMIYSHASGSSMCPDEESGHDMGISELSRVLGPRESLDFLALELCNMGGIEVAYEWRPGEDRFGAEILLAIPNAGPPLDWDRAFARIRSPGHDQSPLGGPYLDPAQMEARDFAQLVIAEGKQGRTLAAQAMPGYFTHESAGAYDLRRAAQVKGAVDALAAALAVEDARKVFQELRAETLNYDGDSPFADLYDLCSRLGQCEALSAAVHVQATKACAAIDDFVIASFGMSAYSGFEEGQHGVFIAVPVGGLLRKRISKWYTPLTFEAGGKEHGRWAFLGDGSTQGNGRVETWFELLDSWFDADDDGGGVNGYRP